MEEKFSNVIISSDSTQQIQSPESMYAPREGKGNQ